VQKRQKAPAGNRFLADFYRIYWFLAMDLGLHLLVLGILRLASRRRRATRIFFRNVLPWFVLSRWTATDRSDRQLTMAHDLFQHIEEELYVRRGDLPAALQVLQEVLQIADDALHRLNPSVRSTLLEAGLLPELEAIAGTWTHHYPICIRRVAPDDTLISVTAGGFDDWYSISLISYAKPREEFLAVATFLARALGILFCARPHWGKWFPWQEPDAIPPYPGLPGFRRIVARHDPRGVFRNPFVDRVLETEV
jgi:hypothetical protein